MADAQERLEWFKKTYQQFAQDINDLSDWQTLHDAAIYRRRTGDLAGAIEAMVKAIRLMRTDPTFAEKLALSLNYLAEMHWENHAIADAEIAIRDSIELSRLHSPGLFATNLRVLAEIQRQKGQFDEALAIAKEAYQREQQQSHAFGVTQAEELIRKIQRDISGSPKS